MMILSILLLACTVITEPAKTDAHAVADRCCAYYQSLRGFSVTMTYTPPATPLVLPGMAQEQRVDFSAVKPDKLRITQHLPGIGALDIISDGTTLIVSLPSENEFAEHAAPTSMQNAQRDIPLGGAADGMVGMCYSLLSPDPRVQLLEDATRLSNEGTVTIGDATCDIIRMHPRESPSVPSGMSADLLIARGTHPWLLGYNINLPAMEDRGMPNPAVIEIRARNWKVLDEHAEDFTFTAGDAKKIDDVFQKLRERSRKTTPSPPGEVTPPDEKP